MNKTVHNKTFAFPSYEDLPHKYYLTFLKDHFVNKNLDRIVRSKWEYFDSSTYIIYTLRVNEFLGVKLAPYGASLVTKGLI